MSNINMKWNEQPTPKYKEHLSQIEVTLVSAPRVEHLRQYIPEFVHATWEDRPKTSYTIEEQDQTIEDLFNGNLLPTAFETIRMTFRVEGLDLIDVTHLIRHRVFSFSAQCTADRDMRNDTILIKPSILADDEFRRRYEHLHDEAFQLYADMVDSQRVSILDARTVLPRSTSHFYYMNGNIRDFMNFIRTRKDRQIQPESDNMIALRMWVEIVKMYPFLKDQIDINESEQYYCKTLLAGTSSNTYYPRHKNIMALQKIDHNFDVKDYEFLYECRRDEFPGGDTFLKLEKQVFEELERL